MSTLTFVPLAPAAKLVFGLEGESPFGEIGGKPSVNWRIGPDGHGKVSLATGQELKDLLGFVNVRVGDATPMGKGNYTFNEGSRPAWGMLQYFEPVSDVMFSSPAKYYVSLHVSQQVFDRIERLAAVGRLPILEVSFPQSRPPGSRSVDAEKALTLLSEFGDYQWDNKTYRSIEIAWCGFTAPLGFLDLAGPDEDESKQAMDGLLPPTRADVAAIQRQVASIDGRLARYGKSVATVFWIALVAYLIRILSGL